MKGRNLVGRKERQNEAKKLREVQVHKWLRAPDGYIRLPLLWSSDGRKEGEGMSLKVQLEVSDKCEGTAFPYWMIIDPSQNFLTGEDGVHAIASMVTGPFFSREEAERELEGRRYHYGASACVYCHSGCYSSRYANAVTVARELG